MIELLMFWTAAGLGASLAFAIADSLTGMALSRSTLVAVLALSGPAAWFFLALFVISVRAERSKA
jgi:hypothetical protein